MKAPTFLHEGFRMEVRPPERFSGARKVSLTRLAVSLEEPI